jgi:hypothetical protein
MSTRDKRLALLEEKNADGLVRPGDDADNR